MSTTVMICFRGSPELRAQLEDHCRANSLNISELLRVLVHVAIGGETAEIVSGYQEARRLAIPLAHEALTRALNSLPGTYEEAREQISNGFDEPYPRS